MIRTIILEDEPLIAKNLKQLLAMLAPDLEVVELLSSLQAAEAWWKSNPEPDLLFMDIQLSDGVSFDLFNRVSITCPIIFTTAYNEYAIRAFKVNSIDYLLKPIDSEELKAALVKLRQLTPQSGWKDQINTLLQQLQSNPARPYKERFLVHYKNALVPVQAADVAFFQKDSLIFLVTKDGRKLVTDFESMDEIEHLLDPARFYRANRQFIMGIQAVGTVKTHYTGKLQVMVESPHPVEVEVSREKATDFKHWLNS